MLCEANSSLSRHTALRLKFATWLAKEVKAFTSISFIIKYLLVNAHKLHVKFLSSRVLIRGRY